MLRGQIGETVACHRSCINAFGGNVARIPVLGARRTNTAGLSPVRSSPLRGVHARFPLNHRQGRGRVTAGPPPSDDMGADNVAQFPQAARACAVPSAKMSLAPGRDVLDARSNALPTGDGASASPCLVASFSRSRDPAATSARRRACPAGPVLSAEPIAPKKHPCPASWTSHRSACARLPDANTESEPRGPAEDTLVPAAAQR